MKNKEEKAQETIIKRVYEKPVLIVISSKAARGKEFYHPLEQQISPFDYAPS